MKSIEQQRAAHALAQVGKVGKAAAAGEEELFKRRYQAYVERLGPAIVMNGLGQALATERAAAGEAPSKPDERAHLELYTSVQAWLCRKPGGVYPGAEDLLAAIVEHEESAYLHAQAECLAWLEWHKKFCRAQFPKGEG
jgi:CRISPR-associated protein Cmr5